MKSLVLTVIFLIGLLAVSCLADSASARGVSHEKKIFAHYMGCFPADYGAISQHRRSWPKDVKYDGKSFTSAIGGHIVNWDLVPQDVTLTPEQSAELEIRRAMRAGIDGFAVDAWAGGDGAKAVLDELFAAAERMNVPFDLTVCLDPSCHKKEKSDEAAGNLVRPYTETITWLLAKHGTSPRLAKRDGKPLIFGYSSHGVVLEAPKTPAVWEKILSAYQQIEKNVGQPLFWHFDFDGMARHLKGNADQQKAAAAWAGKNFSAVGGFLGADDNWSNRRDLVDAIKSSGAEWSQPLFYQYNNKAGSLMVGLGTDILRRYWQSARETDSTLIQFVTWNDYSEDTTLAPGYSTGYTITSLNRYFADWWKLGREPAVSKDQVHLVFRRSVHGAPSFPFQMSRIPPDPGVLEIATLLTAPARVTVPGYVTGYDAPAGLYVKQFPLRVGKVSATLARDGREVLSLTAPEEVTDKPFRQDNSMVCYSSNYLDEWRADFADRPPLLYSEYGDVDGDGLPNWFEMYWFGKFPDMSTAAGAKPGDDPDGDGLTNLQEYQNQTDPTSPEKAYAAGFVWDFDAIHERGVSFNPDRDANRHDVWFYFYKHGEAGRIPHDGNYTRTPSSGVNVPFAGRMAHFSPYPGAPESQPFRYTYGWIARRESGAGNWQLIMRPRANAAVILGWRSPVTGTIRISFRAMRDASADKSSFILDVARNNETKPLHSLNVTDAPSTIELNSVAVKAGDFLYLIADGKPSGGDLPSAYLENIRIELETLHD